MRPLLILLLFLFLAVPLHAGEKSKWIYSGTTATDFGPTRTYLDKESVKLYGNVVIFWAKHVLSKDIMLEGSKVDMFQKLYNADCITRHCVAITLIGYYQDELVETIDLGKKSKWIRLDSDSPMELLAKTACTIGEVEMPQKEGF